MSGRLLTAEEAAELLGVKRSWIMDAARHDRIPYVKIGRYVRIDEDALRDWIRDHQRGPATASG